MRSTRAYDDFLNLLFDLEDKPSTWEKQNLFLALSYRPKREIPGALQALAERLQKPLAEISAEFETFNAETKRQRTAKQ